MGHAVSYVVDGPGVEFNAKCPAWDRASGEWIETLRASGSLWSGDVPAAGIAFTAELTGVVTIVWLTTRYTVFLTDPNRADAIRSWEKVAFSGSSERVVRVDEILLLKWEASAGEWWFRDRALASKFWEWLGEQDPLHWQMLQREAG